MTFDDTITRDYLYVDQCPPRARHEERKPHVHRLDRPKHTLRNWTVTACLAWAIFFIEKAFL